MIGLAAGSVRRHNSGGNTMTGNLVGDIDIGPSPEGYASMPSLPMGFTTDPSIPEIDALKMAVNNLITNLLPKLNNPLFDS
jgi:hypothetical protein